MSHLEPYNNAIYKHDFICISETFFDSSIIGHKNIQLNGYNLIKPSM